jgi:uncharacterized protein (DUF433 family)
MKRPTKLPKNIVVKPEVRFGRPVIAGTRVAVSDILALLEGGYNLKEIPEQYEKITLPQVKQALRFAADILSKEEILTLTA